MKKLVLELVGVDSFNRAIFTDEKRANFYGSTDILFSAYANYDEIMERLEPEDLLYFGSSFDCEPMGTPINCEVYFK